MSNIKTVLRQALEALEHMCENTTARNTYNATKVADAMMAASSALAEEELGLRTAAQQFVSDYENGDLGDLKHYARALRAALALKEKNHE
jgi:hypothetical protein